MIKSKKPRAKKTLGSQAQAPQNHHEPTILIYLDDDTLSTPKVQADNTADTHAIHGAQIADGVYPHTDETQVAQTARGSRPKNSHVFTMDITKPLLANFLDRLGQSHIGHPSYLDKVLSQWLAVWQEDPSHALLVYILDNGSGQHEDRELNLDNLEDTDRIKADLLLQQCSPQKVCLHLAKMTSTIRRNPTKPFHLNVAIDLYEIRDHNGALLIEKPVTVGRESIIQKSLLKDRSPSPSEGSPTLQTDTLRTFHDWVSSFLSSFYHSLLLRLTPPQVLLIMPQGHRFKFLNENVDPLTLQEWIESESADFQLPEGDPTKMEKRKLWGLAQACKSQLNNIYTWLTSNLNGRDPDEWYRQSHTLEAIVRVSIMLRDPVLFGEAITLNPAMLSLVKWEEIGCTIDLTNFTLYSNS